MFESLSHSDAAATGTVYAFYSTCNAKDGSYIYLTNLQWTIQIIGLILTSWGETTSYFPDEHRSDPSWAALREPAVNEMEMRLIL